MIAADGTIHNDSTYRNRGCRCDVCRAAHTAYVSRQRRLRYESVAAHGLPDSVSHGASAYHNWGCRCDVCRSCWAAEQLARYHARKRAAA